MEWRIDPTNPAEILACGGAAHLAWRADAAARTGFVDGDGGVWFTGPEVAALSRPHELEPMEGDAVLLCGVVLDWWRPWGLNPGLKTWSGRQTAWTVHRSLAEAAGGSSPGEWLTFTAPARGRLGLDPSGTWDTQRLGFSLNEHREQRMCCRPFVELLASVGLQAFPLRRSEHRYRYRLWRPAALPAAVAAFGGRGDSVHSLGGFEARTNRNGRNKVFRRARPLPESVTGRGRGEGRSSP